MAEFTVNRRQFMGMAGATAASLALASARRAGAVDAQDTSVQSWLGEEPATDDVVEELETDVVVVGAGTGGYFAACSAAEEGAQVILIEKTAASAGVRGDLGAVGSRYQQEDGCEIDEQALLFDLHRYANGNSSYALHRTWLENSGETIDWYGDVLAAAGVTLWHEAASEDPDRKPLVAHWPVGHSPEWPTAAEGETQLSGNVVLEDYLVAHGGQTMFETAMVKLDMSDGVVTGVIAQNADGGVVRIKATRGVILATGGYGRNAEMMEALQPETGSFYSLSIAKAGATGDGIKACLWAGAAMDATHTSMLFDRCALPTDGLASPTSEDGMFFNLGSHPWLKVNLEGERFCNEGSGVYDWILHAGAEQPGGTYCTIFDESWASQAEQMDMHGCARMYPYENGAPANETVESMSAGLESLLDAGYLQKADTPEELAEKLGLPQDAFAATVERYNELCEVGVDEDFGKEPFRMCALNTPPLYGVRTSGVLLCTLDGIRIDETARALRKDGTPIEGLYVVGNDSGGYFDGSYPNTLTGCAAGRTITFARIAGKAAASR